MDALLQHILEQVAFDGSSGASLSRLWEFIDHFFHKQQISQNVDQSYKLYIWSVLIKCPEIAITKVTRNEKGFSLEILHGDLEDLDHLVAQYGDSLSICTVELRQWTALTGHGIDHKLVS